MLPLSQSAAGREPPQGKKREEKEKKYEKKRGGKKGEHPILKLITSNRCLTV
jgi:hypothetical protein